MMAAKKRPPQSIPCGHCQGPARRCSSRDDDYPYSRDFGPVYLCRPCGAYVGTHPGGMPKGVPANAEQRAGRQRAHALLDPVWQCMVMKLGSNQAARRPVYRWLAGKLGKSEGETHIACFLGAELATVLVILSAELERAGSAELLAAEIFAAVDR
jgi:hypothetical protein